jgi:hypothetical protein
MSKVLIKIPFYVEVEGEGYNQQELYQLGRPFADALIRIDVLKRTLKVGGKPEIDGPKGTFKLTYHVGIDKIRKLLS